MFLPVLLFLAAAPQEQHQTAGDHYQKGTAYFRNGQLNEAIVEFEEVTRIAPSDARAWKSLGAAYAAQGNNRKAEGPLRKACEMDRRDADACYYFGLASYNLGKYEAAIEAYKTALKAGGAAARVRSGLGLALEATGRAEDAERELRAAILQESGKSIADFDPRVELGAFLYRQGRLAEALVALEESVKVRPDSARAFFELARALILYDRLADAASRLNEAVRLDPNYAAAHLLLGRVYFRLGREAEGERQMQIGQKLTSAKP